MKTQRKKIDWAGLKARLANCETTTAEACVADATRLNEVFRARAKQFAERRHGDAAEAAPVTVLVFQIGDERCGIELGHVAQVFPSVPITPLPGVAHLLGVANLQGALRSVIDPRRLMEVSAREADAGNVVLIRVGDKLVGMHVDEVHSICQLKQSELNSLQDNSAGRIGRFAKWKSDSGILVFDAEAIVGYAAGHGPEDRRTNPSGD